MSAGAHAAGGGRPRSWWAGSSDDQEEHRVSRYDTSNPQGLAAKANAMPPSTRVLVYVAAAVVVSFVGGVIGEIFFPAELIGDTGENDFAGLAGVIWAFCALVCCAVIAAGAELYLSARRNPLR